ncbi:glycoside hydrolase family 12 protein [Collybiopsis luxurians FD-317 M1]|uniref:Glycoside hydrolase family 12 protein n=1 Tax=Collybiopsis luxurians FD-317 M1 TaxID=944289 RepID=A0A0D0B2P5_9AGAR|nr:glycoside hydrolase family 12 protein [Collybiopsis luxurians FD-317 M1]
MFSSLKLPILLTLLPFVLSAPLTEVEKRGGSATLCGQWDTATSGNYELILDQWGLSGASSGSDCASITSLSGSTIAWTTSWTWVGGTGVKSFTNIQLNAGINRQLSAISTIQSTWNWKQTSSGTVVADVAYDLFTSNSAGGSATNEIMIWLANYNAGPISSSYNSAGQPNPIATGISLAGHTWNLYSGSNGANAVWSFLPSTSGTTITSFSGDIKTFLTYLTQHEGLSTSQYLTTFQAGTEATSGSAVTLTTTSYSAVIN